MKFTYDDVMSPLYQTERDKEVMHHCLAIFNRSLALLAETNSKLLERCGSLEREVHAPHAETALATLREKSYEKEK